MRMLNSTVRFANVFASMQNRAVVVFNVAVSLLRHLLPAHLLRTLGKSTEGIPSTKRCSSSPDWDISRFGRHWIRSNSILAYVTIQRSQSLRKSG
jgi:hypothetical protein